MPRQLSMPPSTLPALIRTDFSDDAAWNNLVTDLLTERYIEDISDNMAAYVAPIDDRQYEGMTMGELLDMVPNLDYDPSDPDINWDAQPKHFPNEPDRPLHAYIVDARTFANPDRPILAVNFFLDHGQYFRLAAEAMVLVEANLSIGNLDFGGYDGGAEMEPDHIYRA